MRARLHLQSYFSAIFLLLVSINTLVYKTSTWIESYKENKLPPVDFHSPILNFSQIYSLSNETKSANLILSDEEISTTSGEIELHNTEISNGAYLYSVDFHPQNSTAYSSIIRFSDKSGNITSQRFFFNIDKFQIKNNNENCSKINRENLLLANVDSNHCVEYENEDELDLVEFKYKGRDIKVNSAIYLNLLNMLSITNSNGIKLKLNSGYRSVAEQEDLKEFVTNRQGDNYAAEPGYSEHHLGYAIDFGTEELDETKGLKYEETEVYRWLDANAYKYGFAMSYPKGKEDITGYNFEPWHWRYIGIEDATNYYKLRDKLTLNEYLQLIKEEN